MSENKYTAADFAAAEFAKRPNGGMAARLDPEDTLPWRVVNGRGLWSWFNDYDMAARGWVPVPASPATPTITESRRDHLTRYMTASERDAFHEGLFSVGGTVVPDPAPTDEGRMRDDLSRWTGDIGRCTELGLAKWLIDNGWTKNAGDSDE